jgi:zinc protease
MTDHNDFSDQLTANPLADGLHSARLSNGMRVIIKEDHRSPVAICNVWVRVGSNREPEKLRGWSHGIEHMLFKGTTQRNEGDFANEVAEAGGSTNAGTGYETTNYHITLPAGQLPVAIDILSDVLFHSTFESASLDAERKVLVHENHMYDDIPFGFGVTWRWGMELAFDQSPYQHPIGGKDENLLERDRDDILAFFRSAYRADNMTVVVAGDIDPEAAFAAVSEQFGSADADREAADSSVELVSEPAIEEHHSGCRLRVEYGDIQRAYAKLIFPGPGENDPDRSVLSVVRRVLSDGRSCRLYRSVQEEQKLIDEFAVMTETGPREGIVLVDIETDAARLARAITAVSEVLAELAAEGCTEQELDRARVRVSRSFLLGEETVQGQASTIGYYDAMDDLPGAFAIPERVAQVTARRVADFSRRMFDLDNLSCVIYLPAGTDPAPAGIPTTAEGLRDLLAPVFASVAETVPGQPVSPPVHGSEPQKSPPQKSTGKAAILTQAAPSFRTTRLGNGVPVYCRVDHAVPVVALAMTARGGATGESADDSGLAALMQMVQVKGAGQLNAEALHEALEGEGASLSPRADRDYSGLFLSGLSERLYPALDLTDQVLNSPTFAIEEVEQERRLALEQLASLHDNPFQSATIKLRKMMYGDHPYGRPLVGTESSLPSLDRNGLLARYEQAWRPDNLQVVVSGSFDEDRLLERLEHMLDKLPLPSEPLGAPVPLAPINPPAGVRSERISREQNQSVVLAAWPGPATPDVDRVPLILLKEILNGQSGRLFDALRNKRSLCYNTGTISTAGYGQGMFVGYVLTAPESEEAALDELLAVLRGMASNPAHGEEFERARAKLLGNLTISSQANSSRVSRTDRDLIYGRGANDLDGLLQSISACTPGEIQALAGKLFAGENRFQVVLGP